MWSGYAPKILDRWTPSIYNTPRWFNANAYSEISDVLATPSYTDFVSSTSFIPASGNLIPASWISHTETTTSTGNVLQSLFEVFTLEKEHLYQYILNTQYNKQYIYDESEVDCIWVLEATEPVDKVEIGLSDGSFITIDKALGYLDLFNSGQWKWYLEDNRLFVFGLDLQEQETEKRVGNWHFIKYPEKWDSNSLIYVEHPTSKNWIPTHPSKVRGDGFLNFEYSGSMRIRARYPEALQYLDTVTVKVNDTLAYLRRVDLWNTLDERGLWARAFRRPGEINKDFSKTIIYSYWFTNQTYKGSSNFISTALRASSSIVVSPTASGFNTSGHQYTIRNLNQYNYLSEYMSPDPDSFSGFRSIYAEPTYPYSMLYGSTIKLSSSGSVYTPDAYVDNATVSPQTKWVVQYWTDNASSVQFTANMPENIPDLVVLLTSKVSVTEPSTLIKRQAFKKSATLKWRSYTRPIELIEDKLFGLASFT